MTVALALLTTVSPVAHGNPRPPAPAARLMSQAPTTHQPAYPRLDQIPAAQTRGILLAGRLQHYATNRKTHVLDYAKANRYDQGHVTFRRLFAAGWLTAGGRITHISSAERKKVHSYVRRGDPFSSSRDHLGRKHCTGQNKVVTSGTHVSIYHMRVHRYTAQWYDSCQTNLILFTFGTTAAVAAALAYFIQPAAPFLVVFGTLVAVYAAYIDYRRNLSDVGAIICWSRTLRIGVSSQ